MIWLFSSQVCTLRRKTLRIIWSLTLFSLPVLACWGRSQYCVLRSLLECEEGRWSMCVLCNNTVHRGGRGHRVITRWLGISRCPDRDLSPKHLLLLSNLKWKDSSVPLWSVLSDCCCFYTSEHQKQDDHGFFHVQDTDFFHHLHGSAGGWVTFLWFIWILGFY